jgi:hypothetical protein
LMRKTLPFAKTARFGSIHVVLVLESARFERPPGPGCQSAPFAAGHVPGLTQMLAPVLEVQAVAQPVVPAAFPSNKTP